jgi:hypothetical protein
MKTFNIGVKEQNLDQIIEELRNIQTEKVLVKKEILNDLANVLDFLKRNTLPEDQWVM